MNFDIPLCKMQVSAWNEPMDNNLGAIVQGSPAGLFWCVYCMYKYKHLSILLTKPPFTIYYLLLKPTVGLIEVCRLHYTYLQIKHLLLVLKLLQKFSLLLHASFSNYEFHTLRCFCVSFKALFIGSTKVKLD